MGKVWAIAIKGDTNDGDYVMEISKINEKTLKKIKPLIDAIKKFKPYKVKVDGMSWTHRNNWASGEVLREDLGEKDPRELYSGFDDETHETFEELLPFGERGIHTIEEILLFPWAGIKKIM